MQNLVNKNIWKETKEELEKIGEKYLKQKSSFYQVMTIFEIYQNLYDTINATDEELEKLTDYIYQVYMKIDKISIEDLTDGMCNVYKDKTLQLEDIINMNYYDFIDNFVPFN